jgi:hypothetical protein
MQAGLPWSYSTQHARTCLYVALVNADHIGREQCGIGENMPLSSYGIFYLYLQTQCCYRYY